MDQSLNLVSNSSDEASYCSMFDDDCDNEMNNWFEAFFYNVDQAVFFDKKLDKNYEKIEKECQVWNNLFKMKKVDLMDKELQQTIFTAEKFGKNRSQLLEEFKTDKLQLMGSNERAIMLPDEIKYPKSIVTKKSSKQKAISQYHEGVNDRFDRITLLNQIKQNYIRKHILNSIKSEMQHNSSSLFPVTTSGNLNRRKESTMDLNRTNDEMASSCFYFFPSNKKREHKKKVTMGKEDTKGRIRTINSIMKIDKDNTSNLILNSEQIIQPKAPLVLPPILSRNYDLPERFDKITIHDQNEAILNCDKTTNQCSINLLKKSKQFKASGFDLRQTLSISDEYILGKKVY